MESDKKAVGRFDKSKGNVINKEHIEKVINGTAKVRKKGDLRKLKDAFIVENASDVKSHILSDVVIPELKRLIVSIIKDGAEMLFNGHVSAKGKGDRFSNDYVAYDRFASKPVGYKPAERNQMNARFGSDDILFESYSQAKSVIDSMHECIRSYGHVTVGAMYDMVDITAPFTSYNYGWLDISGANIERVYGGYVIKLPRAIPIEP